jgi:hypothetical protein
MLQKAYTGANSALRRRRAHLEHSQFAYARYADEARLMAAEAMKARDNGYLDTAAYFQREAEECAVLARAWAAALISAMSS